MALGIPFKILGKDVAGDLRKHIKKITGRFGVQDNDDIGKLQDKLEGFLDEEQDTHGTSAQKKAYLSELKETTEALLSSIDQMSSMRSSSGQGGSVTVGQFKKWLSDRLGGLDFEGSSEQAEADYKKYKEALEKENPIILTTAHKAKGLEWKRVYVLRYDQFPHPKSRGKPKDEAQEANAKYVTLTRGRDAVHVVKLDGQPGYVKR
jgi:superfamily I DNA/RNA helicase